MSAVQRNDFATSDVEVVRQIFAASNGDGLRVEAGDDAPFAFEQVSGSDGVVTVSRIRFTGRVSAALERSSSVVFTDVAEGRYDWRSGAVRGDQHAPLILPAGHDLAVDFEAVRSVLINVDTAAVERWLVRYDSAVPTRSLLRQAIQGSDAVRRAIRFYGEVMPSEAFDSELVRAGLLDVLLSVTAHQLSPDPSEGPGRQVPAALARAQEHLRAHAGEPVTVADAAEAARLSVRALQAQFRTWLDVSPAQYLRNLRLSGARAALVEARELGAPVRVADVARRWGFAHLGRFASTYEATFGELPSATLRGGSDRP